MSLSLRYVLMRGASLVAIVHRLRAFDIEDARKEKTEKE